MSSKGNIQLYANCSDVERFSEFKVPSGHEDVLHPVSDTFNSIEGAAT